MHVGFFPFRTFVLLRFLETCCDSVARMELTISMRMVILMLNCFDLDGVNARVERSET